MDPIKLLYTPGINREVTEYTAMGGYVDGNLVRFVKGQPQSLGGWEKLTQEPTVGTPRTIFPFTLLDGTRLYTVSTEAKFYLLNGIALTDITPLRDTAAGLVDPFATTSGSSIVTVTDVAHGAEATDYIIISGATDTGGILAAELNLEFQIVEVIDVDTYTIDTGVVASSTVAAGGGAAVTIQYLWPTGINATTYGYGWGIGPYGVGGYGEPSVAADTGRLRLWAQDRWGEDIVSCVRDGPLFYFDTSLGLSNRMTELTAISGASQVPVVARQVLLSDNDRHMMALATNALGTSVQDPLLIRWCDRENLPEWNPGTTTTSGSLRLDAGTGIVTGVKSGPSILVFTDLSLHEVKYVGAPLFFGQVKVADNVHIMGPLAAVAHNSEVYFMGIGKFHFYNGVVQDLVCDIEEYVFDQVNFEEREKIVAGFNSLYGEVFWLIPTGTSTEPDFYVIYNIVDRTWAYGSFGDVERTGWLDVMFEQYPLATACDGYIYLHDKGTTDGSQTPAAMLDSWVEAAPIEIGSGDDFMHCSRIIPDVDFDGSTGDTPEVQITIEMVDAPGKAPRDTAKSTNTRTIQRTASVPVQVHTSEKKLRLRGRSMKYKIATAATGTLWRQGTHRLYAQPDGKR